MKKVMIMPKIEFFVLVLILISVFMSFDIVERKQTYTNVWYVDMHKTGFYANDGTSLNDAWWNFSYVDWNCIQNGDVLYVVTGNGTDYSISNTLVPQDGGIDIIGIDSSNYSAEGFPTTPYSGYTTKTVISHNSDTVLELSSSKDFINVKNIVFDNTSSTSGENTVNISSVGDCSFVKCEFYCDDANALEIDNIVNSSLSDCVCVSNDGIGAHFISSTEITIDDCNFSSTGSYGLHYQTGAECEIVDSTFTSVTGISMYVESLCASTIEDCNFIKTDSYNVPVVKCEDFSISSMIECTTSLAAGKSCSSLLEVKATSNALFARNLIHTSGNLASSDYGIHVHFSSQAISFDNNSVFGNFTSAGVMDDDDNNQDISWLSNTINNESDAYGYYGVRTNNKPLDAFLNNIVMNDSSSDPTIYISGTPSYWKPATSGFFDFNCYYNNDGSGDFGYWSGSGSTSVLSTWRTYTGDETNTLNSNPSLAADGYHLTNSSTAVMYSGIHLTVASDIDGYDLPPVLSGIISMGCDQATVLHYTCPLMTGGNTIDFGAWAGGYPPNTILEINCYGGPSASVTNVAITGVDASAFTFTGGTSFTVTAGIASTLSIGIAGGTPPGHYYQAHIDITYNGTKTAQVDSLWLNVWLA